MENTEDHRSGKAERGLESADALIALVVALAIFGALLMIGVASLVTAIT